MKFENHNNSIMNQEIINNKLEHEKNELAAKNINLEEKIKDLTLF